MTTIDPTARIAAGAIIADDAIIGPYCVIGAHVSIGAGCKLLAHVHVTGHTTIGPRTSIAPFASLGTPPQSVRYRGGPTRLAIGADCDIREHVTMNIGTEDDRGVTEIGDKCFLMVNAHVGHDCKIGSNVTMANNVALAGHVVVGDYTFIGGNSGVHQFVRIGESVMIAGVTGVAADIIPYGFCVGQRGVLDGLNVIGMRRRGLSRVDIHNLRQAYRALFLVRGVFKERVEAVSRAFGDDPLVAKVIQFIRDGNSRPLMKPDSGAGVESEPASV